MAEESVDTAPRIIIIGGSAGSLDVLMTQLPNWSLPYAAALIIVLHRGYDLESSLTELINIKCPWPVKEAEDKEAILAGNAYVAPSDYHLLIEGDYTFSLDYSEKINYSRPSIDATFETAARAYQNRCVGVLLSGANADGTRGLSLIKEFGGYTIVQDPTTALVPFMPQHALETIFPGAVLEPGKILGYLQSLRW